MGAAKSIPVVGETVTVAESGIKFAAAGGVGLIGAIAKNDDIKDMAGGLAKGGVDAWVDYSERNIIAAPVRAFVHSELGDEKEAKRVLSKCGDSCEDFVDNLPVAGHVKGIVHYAQGDKEHGDKCMKGATRMVAVAGVGLATGGLGAGVALGGVAGVGTGVVYDGVVTEIDDKPYGTIASIGSTIDSAKKGDAAGYANGVADTALAMAGDFLTGSAAAQAGEYISESNQLVDQKNSLVSEIGEEAAADTIDAGKNLHQLQQEGTLEGDHHVSTRVRDVASQETYDGYNKRASSQIRQQEFAKKGTDSGYNSKTQATKGRAGEFPRAKGKLQVLAEENGYNIEKVEGNRAVNTCAEHHAFESYLDNEASLENARTHSVMSENGGIYAVERCGNCKQFNMGDVPTDSIHGKPVPVKPTQYAKGCSYCGASLVPVATRRAKKSSRK